MAKRKKPSLGRDKDSDSDFDYESFCHTDESPSAQRSEAKDFGGEKPFRIVE